jgi:hypothetical protein
VLTEIRRPDGKYDSHTYYQRWRKPRRRFHRTPHPTLIDWHFNVCYPKIPYPFVLNSIQRLIKVPREGYYGIPRDALSQTQTSLAVELCSLVPKVPSSPSGTNAPCLLGRQIYDRVGTPRYRKDFQRCDRSDRSMYEFRANSNTNITM